MAAITHQPPVVALSTGTTVPATAGAFTATDSGVLFPCAQVAVVTAAGGARAVDLALTGPTDGGATFTTAEARRLAAAIVEAADEAERGRP